MTLSLIFLVLAAILFVFEGFSVNLGTFHPKWWALGVASYLASLAAA